MGRQSLLFTSINNEISKIMLYTESKPYLSKNVKDNVTDILSQFPITRDSDMRLIAMYYRKHAPEPIGYITADEFLNLLANGKMPSPDTITRARRKIQQHNEELRGTTWEKRQERQEEVKQEMLLNK